MERITGRAMPFWLRRKSPTSKIENQRPSKYRKQKNLNKVSLEKEIQVLSQSFRKELESTSPRKQEKMTGGYGTKVKTSSPLISNEGKLYNSYRKFNPDQYRENSPEWQMAIRQYLLDMRKNGHHVNEVTVDKVTKNENTPIYRSRFKIRYPKYLTLQFVIFIF